MDGSSYNSKFQRKRLPVGIGSFFPYSRRSKAFYKPIKKITLLKNLLWSTPLNWRIVFLLYNYFSRCKKIIKDVDIACLHAWRRTATHCTRTTCLSPCASVCDLFLHPWCSCHAVRVLCVARLLSVYCSYA